MNTPLLERTVANTLVISLRGSPHGPNIAVIDLTISKDDDTQRRIISTVGDKHEALAQTREYLAGTVSPATVREAMQSISAAYDNRRRYNEQTPYTATLQ